MNKKIQSNNFFSFFCVISFWFNGFSRSLRSASVKYNKKYSKNFIKYESFTNECEWLYLHWARKKNVLCRLVYERVNGHGAIHLTFLNCCSEREAVKEGKAIQWSSFNFSRCRYKIHWQKQLEFDNDKSANWRKGIGGKSIVIVAVSLITFLNYDTEKGSSQGSVKLDITNVLIFNDYR